MCLLVQLYQYQQNHSRVGLDLPHCLLNRSVLSRFFPCSFFISALTFQQAAETRCVLSDHPVRFSTSDTQTNMRRGKNSLQWVITALHWDITNLRMLLTRKGCMMAYWARRHGGQGMGHAERQQQSWSWAEASSVQAFVQLSGSVPGPLGCHGIPGLRFKTTSTDLWAG